LIAWLSNKGIRTLLDLRSEDEISSQGYDATVREAVVYIKIPFWPSSGRHEKNETDKVQEEHPLELYSGALDSHAFQQTLRSFFPVLSERRNLPLVFHCYAGVDRIGLVTAMLLKLLDTSDERIIGDYLISAGHARRKYITSFLRSLNGYGSPMQYLQDIGLTHAVVENVHANLGSGRAKDEDDVSSGGDSGIV
jgi:protein-tyrosine phosphatase